MSLKVGIVGLPNVGKSTLFNALLKKQVAYVASFPFSTIKPNTGRVPIPDIRLNKIAEIIEKYENRKLPIVPAFIEFVDIAGLVKGAHEGEGLGNEFLSHIREVDLIIHVLRYFKDNKISHVAGSVNPLRDKEILEIELMFADLKTLEKQKKPKPNADKEEQVKWEIIQKLIKEINAGNPLRAIKLSVDEAKLISSLNLLSLKPFLFVGNVSEDQLDSTFKDAPEPFLPICAKTEAELVSLSEDEQKEYLASLGLNYSSLDRLIQMTFKMLGLISFITCSTIDVRAWTVRRGTDALFASGKVHTDFQKKFIKAEVADYESFIELGGWTNLRKKGKSRFEGKDYQIHDGDVIEFKAGK